MKKGKEDLQITLVIEEENKSKRTKQTVHMLQSQKQLLKKQKFQCALVMKSFYGIDLKQPILGQPNKTPIY